MNNKDKFNINKLENIIDNYIKEIYQLDKSHKTLENKLTIIDNLTNNLIDYCIKKKIFFYVYNNITNPSIINNFKIHLVKFIKKLVDPSDNIISKYIIINENDSNKSGSLNNSNWDNISDVNSLIFKNFKKLN